MLGLCLCILSLIILCFIYVFIHVIIRNNLIQFWLHGFQGWVMKSLPAFIVDKAVMSMHAGIRKRGLKKDAKIAAEGKKE